MTTLEDRPIDPLLRQRLHHLAARPQAVAEPPPRPVSRRTRPARGAKLSALALSTLSTVALAGLFARQASGAGTVEFTTVSVSDPAVDASTPTTATTSATTAETTAATTAAPTAATQVADGAYVGAVDSNRWGNVQVQVVYSGGRISDVQIVQYPDGDDKSVSINARAIPTLISESISSQSADVSTVSGATYTSVSYRVSLQSAIDAARAASGVTS